MSSFDSNIKRMEKRYIIRRFELLLVITATTGHLIKNLFHGARQFDDLIELARLAGVPVRSILHDLRHYDHTWNHNMPLIVSTAMFLISWYLFHYMLFPNMKEGRFQTAEFALVAIIAGLILTGSFVLFNTVDVVPRSNGSGMVIGLHDVTHYRKLYVLAGSVAVFTLICLYEFLSQPYYTLYDKLALEPNGRTLNYIIALLICAVAFGMMVSQRLGPFMLVSLNARLLLAVVLFGLTVYGLQEYYFRKVYGVLHATPAPAVSYIPVLIYILLLGLGAALLTAISFRVFYLSLPRQIVLLSGLYVASFFIAYYRKSREKEQIELTTQVSNKSAELASLRSQINPHFLFNALNSLYATALKEKGEKTADGIQKLGDMMRFMLHENNHDRIPLRSEVAYMRNYIDIQRMRLDETQNIDIRVNIQETDNTLYIAPMLLSPFIENAFKHGISFQSPSWIFITLTLDARTIYFKVHNSKHQTSSQDPEQAHSGIGLINVQKRLSLIYPQKHTLEMQKSASDYFIALTITS
jgi:two-component system LytT family sensor kinase